MSSFHIYYPANRWGEYSNLLTSCYLDLRQNSHNYDSLQGHVWQLEERINNDIQGIEGLRIYRTLSWKVSFCFHLSHCTVNSSSPLKILAFWDPFKITIGSPWVKKTSYYLNKNFLRYLVLHLAFWHPFM